MLSAPCPERVGIRRLVLGRLDEGAKRFALFVVRHRHPAVAGHGVRSFAIQHVQSFKRQVAHDLPGFQSRLFGGRQVSPRRVPVIDDRRAIGFRQAIEVGHVEPGSVHIRQQLFQQR